MVQLDLDIATSGEIAQQDRIRAIKAVRRLEREETVRHAELMRDLQSQREHLARGCTHKDPHDPAASYDSISESCGICGYSNY